MRILVEYDGKGNITSVGVPASKFSGQVRLHARENNVVTEVDVPTLKDEQDYQQLEGLSARFRVETGCEPPKLIRK